VRPIVYLHDPLQKWVEAPLIFLFGGVGYYALELFLRGRSHWSMALCGALCFYFFYRLNATYPRASLPARALIGAIFITTVELLAGCWLNLRLGLGIWDYSTQPFHFMGQICLSFSLVWFILCFPLSAVCRHIRCRIFYYDA